MFHIERKARISFYREWSRVLSWWILARGIKAKDKNVCPQTQVRDKKWVVSIPREGSFRSWANDHLQSVHTLLSLPSPGFPENLKMAKISNEVGQESQKESKRLIKDKSVLLPTLWLGWGLGKNGCGWAPMFSSFLWSRLFLKVATSIALLEKQTSTPSHPRSIRICIFTRFPGDRGAH